MEDGYDRAFPPFVYAIISFFSRFFRDDEYVNPNERKLEQLPCEYCGSLYSKAHLSDHQKICPSRPDFVFLGSTMAFRDSLNREEIHCGCGSNHALVFDFVLGDSSSLRRNLACEFRATCSCGKVTTLKTDYPVVLIEGSPSLPQTSLHFVVSTLVSNNSYVAIEGLGEFMAMKVPSSSSFAAFAKPLALQLQKDFRNLQSQIVSYVKLKSNISGDPICCSADLRYGARVEAEWIKSLWLESTLGLPLQVRNVWRGSNKVHDYSESVIIILDLILLFRMGAMPSEVTVDGKLKTNTDALLRPSQPSGIGKVRLLM